MTRRHITTLRHLILVIILVLPSCNTSRERATSASAPQTIGILQLGDHKVINAVLHGFKMRFEELAPPERFHFAIHNANFDMANLPIMARTMVASNAAVLVSITTPASGALVGANRGQKPHVFTFVTDPNQIGYKRPGSLPSVTGLSDQVDYDRELALIREVLPNSRTIGYLITQSESNAQVIHEAFQQRADEYGFELKSAVITGASDLRLAATSLVDQVDLFLFGGDNTIADNIEILFDVASGSKVPVFANDATSIEEGAVAGVSVDYVQMGKRTAEYVMMILGGADPNQMPLEIMKANRLIVNMPAAQRLGLNIPDSLIRRADRVIR